MKSKNGKETLPSVPVKIKKLDRQHPYADSAGLDPVRQLFWKLPWSRVKEFVADDDDKESDAGEQGRGPPLHRLYFLLEVVKPK